MFGRGGLYAHLLVETCFILHNMMVEHRLNNQQNEDEGWYHVVDDDESPGSDNDNDDDSMQARHEIDMEDYQPVRVTIQERIQSAMQLWPQANDTRRIAAVKSAIKDHFRNIEENWDRLYDFTEHIRLRDAIVKVVTAKD